MENGPTAVSEFETRGRPEVRSRKPLWVTGPSRVRISPSPLPSRDSTLRRKIGEVEMSWNPYDNLPRAASFSLTSSDLREGEKLAMPQVSGVLGAGGQVVSPQLSWSGVAFRPRDVQ